MYEVATHSSVRWWPRPDGREFDEGKPLDRHIKLVPAVWLVWSRNQSTRAKFLYYARLYGSIDQATATPLGIDPAAQIFQPAQLPYNVIRSGVNTLTAKVAKTRPTPMYVPVGGDPQVQKRVKNLNQFVAGLFHKHKAYKKGYIATRDAGLYGTGRVLIQPTGRRISLETLFPWEFYVDPVDARYGEPRSVYLVRYLDKSILQYRYCRVKVDEEGKPLDEEEADRASENLDAIETAPVLDESFFPIQDVFAIANRCTVIEAWHLKSGPNAKDGRHTVCLLDHTLLDEPYEREEFPIATLVKDEPLAGYWGMGLGDEMSGFQDEINMMTERVQYAHRIVGGQIWLIPEESGTYDTDYNDDIGVVVRYKGGQSMMPEAINPQPLNPQSYQYFKDLPGDAYGFSGISSMSVQAQKPPGVTAALALQTLDDIETDRFSIFERAHEEFYVDMGRHMLECVKDIADKFGDFEVMSANRPNWAKLSWVNDVYVSEDSYVVQAWPVSLLPKTPAARLQRVMELSANGIFDRPMVLKLLGLPDTTMEEMLLLAPREVCDLQIATMLSHDDPDSGEAFQAPDKYQDLQYGLARAQAYYDRIKAEAVSAGKINDILTIKRLNALSKYMDQAKSLLDDAQAQLMAKAAAAAFQTPQPIPAGQGSVPGMAGPMTSGTTQETQPVNPQAPQ